MKTLVIEGKLVTSNKVEGKYKKEIPQKTAWIAVDEENAKKAEAFGVWVKKNIAVVQVAKALAVWKDGERIETLSGLVFDEEGNKIPTYSSDDKVIKMAIVLAPNDEGNDFYRLTAVQSELKINVQVDPFAELEDTEEPVLDIKAEDLSF